MKRALTSGLILMLILSMLLAAAPTAFASELVSDSSSSSENIHSNESVDSPDTDSDSNPSGAEVDSGDDCSEPPGSTESVTEEEQEAFESEDVDTDKEGASDLTLATELAGTDADLDAIVTSATLAGSEKGTIKDLVALGKALNELYRTIKNETSLNIIRMDDAYLNEHNLSTSFQEGNYHDKVVNLINTINTLLEKCGLEHSVPIHSLPISVSEELPQGFTFGDNTLTLVDTSLLAWDPTLDEIGKTKRYYTITLQLNTGNRYVDNWLSHKGVRGLACQSFEIGLALSGDGGEIIVDDKPGQPEPIDGPEEETPPHPTEAFNYYPQQNLLVLNDEEGTAEEDEAARAGATQNTTPPEPDNTNDADSSQSVQIPRQQIPMASMMVDSSSNVPAANAIIVTLSLVMSVLALSSLRQNKINVPGQSAGDAPFSGVSQGLGIAGIGLGALSATLFVVSQSMITDAVIADIPWTTVMLSITVVQTVCLVGLFASKRVAAKKADPRFKIRLS